MGSSQIPNERKNYTKKELNKKEPEGGNTRVQDHPASQADQLPPTAHSQPEARQAATTPLPEKEKAKPVTPSVQAVNPGKEAPKPISGLEPALSAALVETYLQESCQSATAKGRGTLANRANAQAREFVETLIGIDQRFWSVDAVRALFRSWEAENKNRPNPSALQLLGLAEQIVKGKASSDPLVSPQPTPAPTITQPAQPVESMMHGGEKLDRSAILVNLRQGAILNPEPKEYNLRWIAKRAIWNAAYPDNPIPMPERWAGFADATEGAA